MDWEAWARRAEVALDHGRAGGGGPWRALFAPKATFADPATTTPTGDLRRVQKQTTRIFPDWRQEITSIRGADDWAVFEWVGRGTYTPLEGLPVPIEMHGVTIIDVNADGLVTKWKDYLDRKEPEEQIRRGLSSSPPAVSSSDAPL